MSLSVVGGLGAILSVFMELYGAEGVGVTKVVWLSTFPSLFVGVGKSFRCPSCLPGSQLSNECRKLPDLAFGSYIRPSGCYHRLHCC